MICDCAMLSMILLNFSLFQMQKNIIITVADPGWGGGWMGGGGRTIKMRTYFFYNFVVKNVLCQYLYTI